MLSEHKWSDLMNVSCGPDRTQAVVSIYKGATRQKTCHSDLEGPWPDSDKQQLPERALTRQTISNFNLHAPD